MTQVEIAGRVLDDPEDRIFAYGSKYAKTVSVYDLGEVGDAEVLSVSDVIGTRAIASRISNAELDWFVERAQSAPWRDVPQDALLRDADPDHSTGLYKAATALYDHFRTAAPRGVAIAKISKVLHRKRPGLVPILDSHLLATYRGRAKDVGKRYATAPGTTKFMYWAAIREDLVAPSNIAGLIAVRAALVAHDDPRVARLAKLTDLRLLDILAW